MKTEVISSILMDDLKMAEFLIAKSPKGFEILSSLLKKVKNNLIPLSELKTKPPRSVAILPSYACGLHCEMCSSGFNDKDILFDDYKYFLPEQFDKLSFWLNAASHITFVGLGETLNSPHIQYFLKKVRHKHLTIFTNGIPLNKKKIQSFINAKLNCIVLSFDGKLSLGHGKGDEKYIQSFWKKVRLIQKTKKNFNSTLPVVKLTIVVADENLNDLDNIIATASRHGVTHVMLNLMCPLNEKTFHKSIFVDFNDSKKRLNSIISRWNKKGVMVTTMANTKIFSDSLKICPSVDNWLHFHGRSKTLNVCCGSIEMPLYVSDTPQINHWNSFPLRYFRYLHFCSNRKELPNTCKCCWDLNLKEYSKNCVSLHHRSKNKKKTNTDSFSIYNNASRLKQNNQNRKAEKLFLEVLKLKTDPELKGKVYFHLGEIKLRRKDYRQALRFMKFSVQYCFNHAGAFAYLYLLLMLLGVAGKKKKKRRKKFRLLVPE